MANVLKKEKQFRILHLLVEGNSIRSTERLTNVHRDTICRLLVKAGNQCQAFLDERLRGLTLRHLQADEMWTYVYKKQGRLKDDERDDGTIGDQYLWLSIDEDTKLVPSFLVGKRTADNARRFMVDLASRLILQRDPDRDYMPQLQLSTDAFPAYSEAVDLAFARDVRYGQISKHYRNREQPGRYGPPEMIDTDRRSVWGDVDLWSICTSHVERNNLTTRTFIRRFTRLTLGFSKKLENLKAAIALHLANYNFCWRCRKPGNSGQRRVPPAMAAGVTDRLWRFDDLFATIME